MKKEVKRVSLIQCPLCGKFIERLSKYHKPTYCPHCLKYLGKKSPRNERDDEYYRQLRIQGGRFLEDDNATD